MKALVGSGNDLLFDGTNLNLRVNVVIATDALGRSAQTQVTISAPTPAGLTKAALAAAVAAYALTLTPPVTVDQVFFTDFTAVTL